MENFHSQEFDLDCSHLYAVVCDQTALAPGQNRCGRHVSREAGVMVHTIFCALQAES